MVSGKVTALVISVPPVGYGTVTDDGLLTVPGMAIVIVFAARTLPEAARKSSVTSPDAPLALIAVTTTVDELELPGIDTLPAPEPATVQ